MYNLMENGPVQGAITSILKHWKVYYSKTYLIFFSDICRKCHATFLEHNYFDPIGGLNLQV